MTRSLYSYQYAGRQWWAGQLWRLRRSSGNPERVTRALQAPERVLLVIAGLLGDTVMSTPVITAARRIWPSARLTLLGCRHNCDLLAACPELDARVEVTAFPFTLRHRAEVARLQTWVTMQRFDVALLLLGDQFGLMMARAGIPVRVGVRHHALSPCLTHCYDIGGQWAWGPDERLNALRVLGFDVQPMAPRLLVPASARTTVRFRLAQSGIDATTPFVAVHPFGGTRDKWWPVERVADLADHLSHQQGLWTVLVGGPETRADVPAWLRTRLVDTTGQLSVPELMGLLAEASLVVTTDSGPWHVAGALGRPLVGLFRARRPEHARHYSRAEIVYGRNDSCAQRCVSDRCYHLPCRQMAALSVEDVRHAAHRALSAPVLAPCR